MLRVKILINLQVGSVRVKELRDTLCVCAEAVSSQDLPGNHRGVVPAFFGSVFLLEVDRGDVFDQN